METLTRTEIESLLARAFAPSSTESAVLFLTDLPDREVSDTDDWLDLRQIVAGWARTLSGGRFTPTLALYRNVRRNNADLPEKVWLADLFRPLPDDVETLPPPGVLLADLLTQHPIVVAPTRFSATAPLKVLAARLGFRGATMPGFSRGMLPALRLDLDEIHRQVEALAQALDLAVEARLQFLIERAQETSLRLDLRHRKAHRSSGILHKPGQVGNLPSGEAYIVPYEGEHEGEPSQSEGELPVEIEGEVVIYLIHANRAVAVKGEGPVAARERDLLAREPAYGNLAELGFGVLSCMGVEPIGETLLDEKLGLHIAFGRSDHFGGQVGPANFNDPGAVVHLDRVYLPSLQPKVEVVKVDLVDAYGRVKPLMRDGSYV